MAESLSRLADLVAGTVVGDGTITVSDVTHDSRQAGPGALFVAVPGFRTDGHEFVGVASEAGSPAVVVEHRVVADVPQIVVAESRRAMPYLAAEVHGNPSRRLDVVGVTGTNGKTTVTHMVEAIVNNSGRMSGLIGTINTRIDGDEIPNIRTTPEATDLQRLLALMVERGVDIVAAEVSSHALSLGRVDATHFAVAAFTNLSQDHLDFHGTMKQYFEAKKILFHPERSENAVLWMDDAHGRDIAEETTLPVTSVSMVDATADVFGEVVERGIGGTVFEVHTTASTARVNLPIGGDFNVENALVSIAITLTLGLELDEIVTGLNNMPQIPGRFESVSADYPINVIVDYAHSPDGIAAVIDIARSAATGRVLVLVGAGGDRDRGKRPAMGAAAARADVVVITSDNPRSEEPQSIVDAVRAGIPPETDVHTIVDRAEAISWIITAARDHDTVLILGRGHERGQEIDGVLHPFDDRLVAREVLAKGAEGR